MIYIQSRQKYTFLKPNLSCKVDQKILELPLNIEPNAPVNVSVESSRVLIILYVEATYSPLNVPM